MRSSNNIRNFERQVNGETQLFVLSSFQVLWTDNFVLGDFSSVLLRLFLSVHGNKIMGFTPPPPDRRQGPTANPSSTEVPFPHLLHVVGCDAKCNAKEFISAPLLHKPCMFRKDRKGVCTKHGELGWWVGGTDEAILSSVHKQALETWKLKTTSDERKEFRFWLNEDRDLWRLDALARCLLRPPICTHTALLFGRENLAVFYDHSTSGNLLLFVENLFFLNKFLLFCVSILSWFCFVWWV